MSSCIGNLLMVFSPFIAGGIAYLISQARWYKTEEELEDFE